MSGYQFFAPTQPPYTWTLARMDTPEVLLGQGRVDDECGIRIRPGRLILDEPTYLVTCTKSGDAGVVLLVERFQLHPEPWTPPPPTGNVLGIDPAHLEARGIEPASPLTDGELIAAVAHLCNWESVGGPFGPYWASEGNDYLGDVDSGLWPFGLRDLLGRLLNEGQFVWKDDDGRFCVGTEDQAVAESSLERAVMVAYVVRRT